MSFLFSIFSDIKDKFCRNRWIVWLVFIAFTVGILIGVIVANKNCQCWWCKGRYACIKVVVAKGLISIFVRFLLNLCLFVAFLWLFSIDRVSNYIKLLLCFSAGVYFGSYAELLILSYGLWGVLTAVVPYLLLGVSCCVSVVVSMSNCSCWNGPYSFVDIARSNLMPVLLLTFALVVSTLVCFVLTKLFVVV